MTDLPDRLTLVIEGLRQTLAACAAKRPLLVPIVLLLWGRLHRVGARFHSLVARISAGRVRNARPDIGIRDRPQPPGPPPRLPSGFAWLIRLVPEVAVYACQLQYLLADPEMAALLATAPKAGRILRPLCRMLAIHPGPHTVPPPPPPAAHSRQERKKEDFLHPLPLGEGRGEGLASQPSKTIATGPFDSAASYRAIKHALIVSIS